MPIWAKSRKKREKAAVTMTQAPPALERRAKGLALRNYIGCQEVNLERTMGKIVLVKN